MKRLWSLLLVVLLVPCLVLGASAATSGTCGEDLTWKFKADTGTLTVSGTGAMKEYYKGGAPWYDLRGDITAVVIKDGVTTTGKYAFFGLRNMQKITLPDSLEQIGIGSFYQCRKLTSISLPKNVDQIGSEAFYHCEKLKTLVIPEGVAEISAYMCCGCYELTGITLPDTVERVGEYAFALCAMENISIPNSVTAIGNYAFSGCGYLKSVTVPDGVTELGYCAFEDCYALKQATLSRNLTEVNSDLFAGCESLTQIVIPEGVEKIGAGAFADCTGLKSITIPASVKKVERSSFLRCEQLTDFHITDLEAWLNIKVPAVDPEDDEPQYTLLAANNKYKKLYLNGELLMDVEIPEGITAIREEAFYYCSGIRSLSLPATVTQIGDDAFDACTITELRISDLSRWIKMKQPLFGILSDGARMLLNGEELTDLVIPEDVTAVESAAFYNCISLKSVTLHDAVESIGDYAFGDCANLEYVNLGNGLSRIGVAAFADCVSLKEIEIPDSVKTMGGSAFSDCSGLTRVQLSSGLKYLKGFSGCSGIKTLTIPDSVRTIYGRALENCTSLQSLVLPDSVTTVYNAAFRGCENLSDVFYSGTATQRERISISDENDMLENAAWHYESRITLETPTVVIKKNSGTGKPTLKWKAVSGADGYRVYRSTAKAGTYKLLETVADTGYTDKATTVGKTYYYKVIAEGQGGTSLASDVGKIVVSLKAPAVTLKVDTASGKPKITFEKISGAEKYYIVRSTSRTGTYSKVVTTTSTSYIDKTAKTGTNYYYKVKVLHAKDAADSVYSEIVNRVCDLAKPVVTITLKSGDPRIKWEPITGAVKYMVYRATSKDGEYTHVKTTKTSTSYTDTDVKAGKTYYYKVMAIHENASANSAYSAVKYIKAQ